MLSSVALLKLPECIFNKLIVMFLRSPFFYDQMRSFMKGAAITRVTLKRMGPALLPLPPLAEQRRIVAKVEELMALLDRLEAARTAREANRDRLTAASLARLTAPDADPAEFPANARFALATLPALTTRPDQIKPLRQTILNLAVRGKLVEQDPTDEPASELLKRIALERNDQTKKRKSGLREVSEDGLRDVCLPSSWVTATLGELIPKPFDQNSCAHSRRPIDLILHGWSMSSFQASQQWATISSYPRNTRFESQLSRRNCQTFSTGFSSGERGGSGRRVMLSGTTSLRERCQPAWSRMSTAWAPGATAALISRRCACIAGVSQ
jgi:hypothetical protein